MDDNVGAKLDAIAATLQEIRALLECQTGMEYRLKLVAEELEHKYAVRPWLELSGMPNSWENSVHVLIGGVEVAEGVKNNASDFACTDAESWIQAILDYLKNQMPGSLGYPQQVQFDLRRYNFQQTDYVSHQKLRPFLLRCLADAQIAANKEADKEFVSIRARMFYEAGLPVGPEIFKQVADDTGIG